MKFTDGYWAIRPEYTALYAVEVDDIRIDAEARTLTVYASTAAIRSRGDVLNRPMLSITYSAPAPGIITTRIVHHAGRRDAGPAFVLHHAEGFTPEVALTSDEGVLRSGEVEVRVPRRGAWRADFVSGGRILASSLSKSVAAMVHRDGREYVHEQLTLEPGEQVYGLGERFGAFTKNGQVVDIWNKDGGTSSDQAYKNIPFYLTSRGYGVFR